MAARGIDAVLDDDDAAYDHVVVARIPRAPQALRDEHAALEAMLPTLTSDTIDVHPELHRTAERIAAIEDEIESTVFEIEVRGIGYRAWADLLRKHPPTPAQLKENRALDHNPETFAFEAIAASCVEPTTADEIRTLTAKRWFNTHCWNILWDACLRANVVDPSPKSLAAGLIRRQSGGFATTAVNGASPGLSS